MRSTAATLLSTARALVGERLLIKYRFRVSQNHIRINNFLCRNQQQPQQFDIPAGCLEQSHVNSQRIYKSIQSLYGILHFPTVFMNQQKLGYIDRRRKMIHQLVLLYTGRPTV